MDAAHCKGGRGRTRNRGEASVVEIDGDGAVAVAGKTTGWRGCGGLQLELEVVGDVHVGDEAPGHLPKRRGAWWP
ncbi:unnamed protein product [Triticum turgidum subsp. durum]|uniref:Uncharacterized protein n=1 Tax=Triticum turgidum subsp. durum TaxID=4567 RepID=A0A9R0VWZ5_TRITD|nr:unnamed protein product [Triticum turgidum subsp. durum]